MALPAELPLREILPAVQRLVAPDGDGDSEESTTPTRLSLAPIGGAPFSLDASLDTVGVVDGDLLALQPLPSGPAAPGIVEDVADAAVIFSASRFKPWASPISGAGRWPRSSVRCSRARAWRPRTTSLRKRPWGWSRSVRSRRSPRWPD
ncbi:type VII secretion integral membrane protein EccD [Mycobacterium xenopi 3993]|nr:type VII secretion integral membrane protein EccD [Mycobacterium xenopi 3993]